MSPVLNLLKEISYQTLNSVQIHTSELEYHPLCTKVKSWSNVCMRVKSDSIWSFITQTLIFLSTVNGAMALTQVSSNKCCDGYQKVFEHDRWETVGFIKTPEWNIHLLLYTPNTNSISSSELKCKMKFAIYLPPKAESSKCPVLYWLSGAWIHFFSLEWTSYYFCILHTEVY